MGKKRDEKNVMRIELAVRGVARLRARSDNFFIIMTFHDALNNLIIFCSVYHRWCTTFY
jgi:hypothetical protein